MIKLSFFWFSLYAQNALSEQQIHLHLHIYTSEVLEIGFGGNVGKYWSL